jgi:tetratricopeptide (TPR) repeat protein
MGGGPLSEDALEHLKNYAPRISQNRLAALELGVRVFAQDLENPVKAAAIPGLENLLSTDLSWISAQNREALAIDEFLLRAVKGDISGASARLNTLLQTRAETGIIRMGAEFYYDHANPLRAAELFSRLSGENGMAREADALVLSGEIPGARNIWLALTSPSGEGPGVSPAVRFRSYYNLAATSVDRQEEAAWLEKFFSLQSQGNQRNLEDLTGVYAIIRYSRLLDAERSGAVLARESARHPLLDLELLKHRLDTWPPKRAPAEVWLLLGRHPRDEALYEWAAYFFDHQKLYAETTQLLKTAGHNGMTGSWLDLHRSLARIREGKSGEGEKILKDAATLSRNWRVFANLARIQESRRAFSTALEYYEKAAALVTERKDAARLQLRISRCLQALGRDRESRRALEYALELNPEDINIRYELRKLNTQ